MTAKHPYPAHVVEAVARGMYADDCQDDDQLDPDAEPHPGYYEYAQAALQALWDASRVETIDDIHDVPEHAVVIDQTGFVAVGREHAESDIHYEDYPAHVLHWGNHDR